MTPVARRDLAVLSAGFAVAAWLLVRAWYGYLPPLDWWLPAPLALLAIAEALGARRLKSRLDAVRESRTRPPTPAAVSSSVPVRPVQPMLVARFAVLAQASAYLAAVFLGVWAGVLAYVGPAADRLQAASADVVAASLGVAASCALVVAALWLESVCRVPPSSADDGPDRRSSA